MHVYMFMIKHLNLNSVLLKAFIYNLICSLSFRAFLQDFEHENSKEVISYSRKEKPKEKTLILIIKYKIFPQFIKQKANISSSQVYI